MNRNNRTSCYRQVLGISKWLFFFIVLGVPQFSALVWGQFSPAPLPDLAVENLRFLPENPKAGDSATFSFMVKNIGASGPVICRGEVRGLPSPFAVREFRTGPLGAGGVQPFGFTALLNDQSIGTHQIEVILNKAPDFNESSFSNNYQSLQVTIGPASSGYPDLMVSAFQIRPPSISKNGSAVITVEVRNGRRTPSPPTRIEFGGEVKVKYFFGIPDFTAVPSLGGNQTWSHTFHRIHLDQFFPRPGDYTITATVNPGGRDFPEPNLTNNTQSLLVKVEDRVEANLPPPSLKKQMEQKIQREHILENMPPRPPTVMPQPGPPPPPAGSKP